MSDMLIRSLGRDASLGDALAQERHENARMRTLSPIERAVQLVLARLASDDECGKAALPDAVALSVMIRSAYLADQIVARLPRDVPALIASASESATLAVAARMPRTVARLDQARREDVRRAELARVAAAERVASAAALAPRALGWEDVRQARDLADGTASQRSLSLQTISYLVASARVATTQVGVDADHGVAKSYRYPVSYTRAVANLVVATGDVLVEFTRTQTWGDRRDTYASIVVPADMVAS